MSTAAAPASAPAPAKPLTSADYTRDLSKVPFTQTYASLLTTVRDAGLLNRARGFYAALAAGLGLAVLGLLTGFVLLGDSWLQLILAAVLAFVLTQFAFLAHEASHRAVFSSGPSNDRLGRVLSVLVLGVSYSWWVNKHNRHHANPNQVGRDPDIAADLLSFYPEAAEAKTGRMALFTRHQGTLFFPLLLLEGLNLHVASFRWLTSKRRIDGRSFELAVITGRFIIYLGLLFWALPIGLAFAFFGLQLALFGLYMGMSFAPNHKGMPVVPKDSKLDFFTKQVVLSRNVSGGFPATAMLGGLNYQIEHHLFPSMARTKLAHTREIVMEHCAKLGIPYTETTAARSYAIVVRYLNEVGLSSRDPFACHLVARYRRT